MTTLPKAPRGPRDHRTQLLTKCASTETAKIALGSREALGRLLLLTAKNDEQTLAVLRAAVDAGVSIGMVSEDVLRTLPCSPLAGSSGRIHVLESESVPRGRLACFTSGSTGQAKCIVRTQASWQHSFRIQRELFGYKRETNALVLGSLAHSMHFYGAAESLDRGVQPRMLQRFSPRGIAEICRCHDRLLMYATPAHLNLLVAFSQKHSDYELASVTRILCGGAKLDERRLALLRNVFPAAEIVEYFGTSETSFITIKSEGAPLGSVGKACPTVSIAIRDDEGCPVPAGRTGTIWVSSEMLFERYLIGADANTRWHNGYLTIGDRGYLDEDGHLFFTGRESSMYTIAGQNVYPETIEDHLKTLIPDHDVAVVAVRNSMRGWCLVAATLADLDEQRRDSVLRQLRTRFGPLIAPKRLLSFSDWPYLPSGKVDKKAIASRATDTE